jgi:serine/threonine protein phosphatase PrpC
MMKLRVHGATHVGLVREHNEDSFVVDLTHGFFAVADGLGGLPGGEVASQAAVAALREQLARLPKQGVPDLGSLVAHAHTAVRVSGRPFGAEGIGTTLLVRGAACRAITREHNIENERGLMEGGLHAPGYRYALTRVVGTPEPVRPDFFEEALRLGDRLLLATDGLTDLVELPEIAEICRENSDPTACAAAMIDAALERGGRDNITAIVIAVDEI